MWLYIARIGEGDISVVHVREAVALLRPALPEHSRLWADLGAGTGTFTLALASIIGREGHIVAVDRDPSALQVLRRAVDRAGAHIATVETVVADFITLPTLPPLDGLLIGNALHYVPTTEQAVVLRRLGDALRSGGRMVVVEYEERRPNRWVPYPISFRRSRLSRDRHGSAHRCE